MDMLRPISSLSSFNKVQEMAVVEMIASDMKAKLDPTQYGNRKKDQYYTLSYKNAPQDTLRNR